MAFFLFFLQLVYGALTTTIMTEIQNQLVVGSDGSGSYNNNGNGKVNVNVVGKT